MEGSIFTQIEIEFKKPELVPLETKFKYQFIEYLLGESKNIENMFISGEEDFNEIILLAKWTELSNAFKFLRILRENPYIGKIKSCKIYKQEKMEKLLIRDEEVEKILLKDRERGLFDFLR
ncbi:MAG: hypothetical protein ACFFCS_17915 [Candidatus Hodarchaeota archaeon]